MVTKCIPLQILSEYYPGTGIRRRIKKETNLFTEAGRISNNDWEKVVTSTTTISKSTNKNTVTSGKINRNSNNIFICLKIV